MKKILKKDKFVKKEIEIIHNTLNDFVKQKRYVICFYSNGILYPHPVTDFLDKYYYFQTGSINTERAVADTIVHFLNYVYEQTQNNNEYFTSIRGLKDIELSHLEQYLSFCGEIGNSRKTVERKERYLVRFYYYFGVEKKIFNVLPEIKVKQNESSHFNISNSKKLVVNLYYKKPPKSTYNPTQTIKKDFLTQQWVNIMDKKQARLMFIREFLLLASDEVPDIAFAICLQIYGGLRAAECMNLTIGSIDDFNTTRYGESGFIVHIRDRQDVLFTNSQPTHNEQVKKERDQSILLDPIVQHLYQKHLNWLKIKKNSVKKSETINNFALFINSKGDSMRTHSYRARFNKLKYMYLITLKNTPGRYNDFQEFRNTQWSTHICRGAFTNLCLDSGFSATQTSIMRGDSSPDSMIAYTDILTASQKIYQAIDIISDVALDSFKNIMNDDLLQEWKKVIKH